MYVCIFSTSGGCGVCVMITKRHLIIWKIEGNKQKTPNIGAETTGKGHNSRWIGCDHYFRTWCLATAASGRWSWYLAEQNKITGCHSCQIKVTLSWRLSILKSQIDNKHLNIINRNNTSKDHDAPHCWTCQAAAKVQQRNSHWKPATRS